MDPHQTFDDEEIPWLSKPDVELQTEHGHTSVTEMSGSGFQVGGIVNVNSGEVWPDLYNLLGLHNSQYNIMIKSFLVSKGKEGNVFV